ncbi:MAG: hypothetical protein ACKN82_15450 [Pirellula sp.]
MPVLFVCENNQFATEVPFSYSSSNESVASRVPWAKVITRFVSVFLLPYEGITRAGA